MATYQLAVSGDDNILTSFTNIGSANQVIPNMRLNILGKSSLNREFTSTLAADTAENSGYIPVMGDMVFAQDIEREWSSWNTSLNGHTTACGDFQDGDYSSNPATAGYYQYIGSALSSDGLTVVAHSEHVQLDQFNISYNILGGEYVYLRVYYNIELIPLAGKKYITWEPVDRDMQNLLKRAINGIADLQLENLIETKKGTTWTVASALQEAPMINSGKVIFAGKSSFRPTPSTLDTNIVGSTTIRTNDIDAVRIKQVYIYEGKTLNERFDELGVENLTNGNANLNVYSIQTVNLAGYPYAYSLRSTNLNATNLNATNLTATSLTVTNSLTAWQITATNSLNAENMTVKNQMTAESDLKFYDNLVLQNNSPWNGHDARPNNGNAKNQNIIYGYSGVNIPAGNLYRTKALYFNSSHFHWNSALITIFYSVCQDGLGRPSGSGIASNTIYWRGGYASPRYGFDSAFILTNTIGSGESVEFQASWWGHHGDGGGVNINYRMNYAGGRLTHLSAEIHLQVTSANLTSIA